MNEAQLWFEAARRESGPKWYRRSLGPKGRGLMLGLGLLVIPVLAFAAWAFYVDYNITLSTIDAGPITTASPLTACSVDSPPAGVTSSMTLVAGNEYNLSMADASQDDSCYFRINITNDGASPLWLGAADFTSLEAAGFLTDQAHCGTMIAAGGTLTAAQVQLTAGPDASPGTVVGPTLFQLPVELSDTSASCP